jgi:hypothetical protein
VFLCASILQILDELYSHYAPQQFGGQTICFSFSDQSVQDILEPGREAQLAQHNRAPGPHSVNIVSEPLKAFSTFVTLKQSDAYRSQAQSLVYSRSTKLEAPSLLERLRAMGFLGGMSQCLTQPLNEASCLQLLGGSMDLFQLTFLFGSILAF